MKINGIGNDDDDDEDDRREQIRLKNRKVEELQNKLTQEINNHNNDNHLAKQTIEQTKAIIEEKQKVIDQYEQQIEDMRNNLTGEREKIRKQYDEKYKKIIEDKNIEIERLHDNLLNGPNNNSPTKQAITIQKIQEINEQLLERCQLSEDELAKSRNVINHLEQQVYIYIIIIYIIVFPSSSSYIYILYSWIMPKMKEIDLRNNINSYIFVLMNYKRNQTGQMQ